MVSWWSYLYYRNPCFWKDGVYIEMGPWWLKWKLVKWVQTCQGLISQRMEASRYSRKYKLQSNWISSHVEKQRFVVVISSITLGCCLCPIQLGWQHQAMSNTSSPCLFVLWVSARQGTLTDIIFTHSGCFSLGLPPPVVPGIARHIWYMMWHVVQTI